MKAIIPAAGLGTRFLPATKAVPKEMLPVGDKPTVQYVVEEALAAGADEVLLVTNAGKSAIAAHFSPDEKLAAHLEAGGKPELAAAVRHAGSLPVSFVEQAEPRGLGHAVLCAAGAVLGSGTVCDGTGGRSETEEPGTEGTGGRFSCPLKRGQENRPPVPDRPPVPSVPGSSVSDRPPVPSQIAPSVPGSPVSEPFFVLLGDVIVPEGRMLPRMREVSRAHNNASVIAVLRVPQEEVSRFGIIAGEVLDGDGLGGSGDLGNRGGQSDSGDMSNSEPSGEVWRVTALVEKPPAEKAPSDLAIFGRYLLSPTVMRLLAHTAPGAGGEIQLTDALAELLATEELYALVIDPSEGLDVGTIPNWIAANQRMS